MKQDLGKDKIINDTPNTSSVNFNVVRYFNKRMHQFATSERVHDVFNSFWIPLRQFR